MVIIGAEGHSDIFNNKYLFHNIFWVYTDAQNSRLLLTVFFIYYLYSQFVQFGHLVEFFNSYVNMQVATPSGVPSSRLLGHILCKISFVRMLGASFLAFYPCLWFWTFPLLAGLGVLLFLPCQFPGECRSVQTCVQCPVKFTKLHVTPIFRKRIQQT